MKLTVYVVALHLALAGALYEVNKLKSQVNLLMSRNAEVRKVVDEVRENIISTVVEDESLPESSRRRLLSGVDSGFRRINAAVARPLPEVEPLPDSRLGVQVGVAGRQLAAGVDYITPLSVGKTALGVGVAGGKDLLGPSLSLSYCPQFKIAPNTSAFVGAVYNVVRGDPMLWGGLRLKL